MEYCWNVTCFLGGVIRARGKTWEKQVGTKLAPWRRGHVMVVPQRFPWILDGTLDESTGILNRRFTQINADWIFPPPNLRSSVSIGG